MSSTVETREYVDGETRLMAQVQDNGCVRFTTFAPASDCGVTAGVSAAVLRELADLADSDRRREGPPVSFTYRNSGDAVIVDATATAACVAVAALTASPEQVSLFKELAHLAETNATETGRPCDVFADDGTTLLVRKIREAKT